MYAQGQQHDRFSTNCQKLLIKYVLIVLIYIESITRISYTCFLLFLYYIYIIQLDTSIAEAKQRWLVIGWVTKNVISREPPCVGMHVKPLVPAVFAVATNPHWARVAGYSPFYLWVIHKEDLCPSSGGIKRLTMMMIYILTWKTSKHNTNRNVYVWCANAFTVRGSNP
jgi:hypothetical protein